MSCRFQSAAAGGNTELSKLITTFAKLFSDDTRCTNLVLISDGHVTSNMEEVLSGLNECGKSVRLFSCGVGYADTYKMMCSN